MKLTDTCFDLSILDLLFLLYTPFLFELSINLSLDSIDRFLSSRFSLLLTSRERSERRLFGGVFFVINMKLSHLQRGVRLRRVDHRVVLQLIEILREHRVFLSEKFANVFFLCYLLSRIEVRVFQILFEN